MIHRLSILSPGIPSVMMVPPDFDEDILVPFIKYNTKIIKVEPPPLAPGANQYYTSVLLKLMAFSLKDHLPHLERVIVMDSDQTIYKPLHPLFSLPETDIAAPVGYWLWNPRFTASTLLVVSLSDRLWNEVLQGMQKIKKNEYDMDLLNRLFYPRRMLVLPGYYATLNSHWAPDDLPLPVWQRNRENGLDDLLDEVAVVHYSALGVKPWNARMEKVKAVGGHALFAGMIEAWRKEAGVMCVEGWDTPSMPK